MPMVNLPITGGFYVSDDSTQVNLVCRNLHPSIPQTQGGLSQGGLLRTPGIEEVQELPNGGVGRGFYRFEATQRLLAIVGNSLYTINTLTANSLHGTIEGTAKPIWADNGTVIAIIVPGGQGYFFTPATGVLEEIVHPVFTDIRDTTLGGVTSVTVLNQRFVYTTGPEIFLGTLVTENNGKNFPGLAFDDAEVSPDQNLRALVVKTELLIFGTNSVEYYRDIGDNSPFPLVRVPGATISRGAVGRNAIINYDNQVTMIGAGTGERAGVYQITPGNIRKISSPAIDTVLQSFTNDELEVADAWNYSLNGSVFLGFNVGNLTIVYDSTASGLLSQNIWHTRQTGDGRWRVQDVNVGFNTLVVLDNNTAKVGRMARGINQEYGINIQRQFTTGYLFTDSTDFHVASVELNMTTGTGEVPVAPVGLNPAEDPLVLLEFSRDAGTTWVSMGTRAIGKIGEKLLKQIWRRLGRMQSSVIFRFTYIAASDIQRLDLDISGG